MSEAMRVNEGGRGGGGYDTGVETRMAPSSLTPLPPDATCECGDVLDEHDGACTVEDCECVHFELNEAAH